MNKVAFILASTDHGPMIVNRVDFAKAGDGVIGVGAQLLGTGGYHTGEETHFHMTLFALLKKYRNFVRVLDCGANIGVCTLAWAKLVEDWGEVIAFEAQDRLFYALCGNIALNNLTNARALLAVIARTSGKPFQVPKLDYSKAANFGGLSLKAGVEGGSDIGQTVNRDERNCYTVPSIAIDDVGQGRVDFIKLDVEGMEMDALDGARKTIDRDRPVLWIEHIKVGVNAIHAALPDYRFIPANVDLCGIHKDDPIWADIKLKDVA